MPDAVVTVVDETVVVTIAGSELLTPLVSAAAASAAAAAESETGAETAQGLAEAAALDASTQVAQVIDILGRADLYEMDRTYDATQFLSRGIELLFAEDYYRIGTEVQGDITDLTGFACTRSTVGYALKLDGTYQSFAVDAPRITDRGITVEPAATNLLLWSNEFDNAAWSKIQATITPNDAVSPDGTMTADRVTSDGASAQLRQSVAVSGTAATFSVHAKKGSGANEANQFGLRNDTSGVDLITGSLNYDTGVWTYLVGSTGASVESVGDYWRVKLTATTGITSGDVIRGRAAFTGNTVTVGQYAFLWGAHLIPGPLDSTPIVTTGAAATRAADTVSQAKALAAGEDFTIFGEVAFKPAVAAAVRVFEWHDGSDANRIMVTRYLDGTLRAELAGASTSSTVASVAKAGERVVKYALIRGNGAYRFHVDGVAQTITPPSVAAGALTTFAIAARRSGTFPLVDPLATHVVIPGVALGATAANALTAA